MMSKHVRGPRTRAAAAAWGLPLLIGLCACSRGDGAARDPVSIRFSPSALSECEGEAIAGEASWRSNAKRVRVEVGQVGSEQRKVFFVGAPVGSGMTEQWVRKGTVFILVDDERNEYLDSFEVGGVPCKSDIPLTEATS